MNAAAFSTGISVRWPRADHARPAPALKNTSPFAALGPATSTPAAATTRDDDENYTGCQELAYQYAVEQTKSAVRAVLLQANASCYQHVLRYFERFMRSAEPELSASVGPSAQVAYPELHGFPTAAIVAGTDATFSEVWVSPLCQVLQRSFPLVFVVREDFPNARRMLEWMAEQLDAVQRARVREEEWLVALIDGFDMLESDDAKAEQSSTDRRATLRTHRLPANAATPRGAKQQGAGGDSADDSGDEAFVAFDSESDDGEGASSGSEGDWRRLVPRKKRRHASHRSATVRSEAKGSGDRAYAKWTVGQLLARIQAELEGLMGDGDPCKMWVATLDELISDRLQSVLLDRAQDGLEGAIQSYNGTIDWLKARISASRTLSSSQAVATASAHVCSTEFSLAQILHGVMRKFLTHLGDAASPDVAAASVADSDDPKKSIRALAGLWCRRISGFLKRHEDYYQLHHFDAKPIEEKKRHTPFFLVCIEQLESFSQHVLDDFLVTWTNFSRQAAQASVAGDKRRAFETGSRLGFIVGVASTASPALRHLNLSIASQIDMQFFSLEDSRKCFDDILEALIVDANLPLCLGGDVMRWVAGRHRTTQSITMFIHALQFLFFAHFQRVPWSFLSHFCLDAHRHKPLQSVQAPPRHLAQWMRRFDLRATTMDEYLLLFSDAKLEELRRAVYPTAAPDGDWLGELLEEVAWLRRQRAGWSVGWKCFRAACSWLDIELRGDDFTTYLALALDGRLANSSKIHSIVQKLGTCSLRIAICLLEDWASICQAPTLGAASTVEGSAPSQVASLAALLSELVLVCRFASETQSLKSTQQMIPRLRQEVSDAFVDKLIVALVQPPRSRPARPQVLQWVAATDAAPLEARLHINYYDRLKEMLLEIEEGEHGGGHADGTSWVNDVSLAFLYYQESAGIYLSLSEWYATFADALQDELAAMRRHGAKKRKAPASDAKPDDAEEVETKARFLRAFCTLRHWGFVKSLGSSQTSDSDTVEKVVFI
ncbi:hypothetical protein PybrP1_007552 [[Pythium] brassicae (nom. inval.)]|nr:hypothetical protein PybrP1_007552 [[Pythium] brassicae (nom. inval.)]